jgi:guanylate cyclase
MYGVLIASIVDTIKAKFGMQVWGQVRKKANLEVYEITPHKQYNESIIKKIVKALEEVTGRPPGFWPAPGHIRIYNSFQGQDPDSLMEMFGVEFINYVAVFGHHKLLSVLGRHMRDFLNELDNLHAFFMTNYPKSKPPSFFVDEENSNGLVLHYRTRRKGFTHYVIGQIKQVRTRS